MFIGIDVTHPAPGDSHSPSISALVGNIDVDATRLDLDKSRATFFHRYTATVRAQHRRTEWIQNMQSMVVERLKHFKKVYASCDSFVEQHILGNGNFPK